MQVLYHVDTRFIGSQPLLIILDKRCTSCLQFKDLDLFPESNQAKKDGTTPSCKECTATYLAEYRLKNHDTLKAYDRFRGMSPERKREKRRSETIKLRSNPEYARKNAEKLARWHEKHPYVKREQSMRKHARLYGVLVETVNYERILERDGLVCHICHGIVTLNDMQFDHVIPPSRGGSHTFDNIKVAHSVCNVRKGDLLMEELEPFHRRGPLLH